MQKIIIFEGPDRTGKSTIAKTYSKFKKIPLFKRSLHDFTEKSFFGKDSFKLAMTFDQTYIVDFLGQTEYSVIFDRAYPSEFVYAGVMNRNTDYDVLNIIDNEFAKLNTKIVICLREHYKYDDELIDKSTINEIHNRYELFNGWTKCDTIKIFTDDENLDREIEEIDSFIEA